MLHLQLHPHQRVHIRPRDFGGDGGVHIGDARVYDLHDVDQHIHHD
jgi:hypothetical protein